MSNKEKKIAYAFFNSCIIQFNYKNKEEVRTLYSVDELKWNEHDSTTVAGCTSLTGSYKEFYTEEMSNVNIYKTIHQADL